MWFLYFRRWTASHFEKRRWQNPETHTTSSKGTKRSQFLFRSSSSHVFTISESTNFFTKFSLFFIGTLSKNNFWNPALKVWSSDFIQNLSQAPSKCLSKHKSEDKLDYLKNPSQNFKNYFCSRVLWIPSNAECQN